ncbi:MAG: 3D-(3,5/4)-trihydroxycyclohexane-1,2-dione acylhydrolase (decyclizing) [Clostridiales bacterium]|jgi:3D-(3,5/4)-trihydroxycyclohexane-1,2-dione acylhydrolase (decyclizing)|nr:3D-(3,5/4)-trihydroxycyclohexane-1,2-dione acylhydrolase (decyclizing) [Clostridiales bacterium]
MIALKLQEINNSGCDFVKLTTAQALVAFLDKQYIEFDGRTRRFVKGVFTLFGHGNVLGLGQALEENPGGLLVLQGRNEQGMTHAAVAFAKQKLRKQIFACTTSVGPGAANMVTAAATATANNIPVLLLPGDVYATRQPDPVLQQIEQTGSLSISTNDAFRPVSKYFDRVSRPEQLMSAMLSAMRVLTDLGDTGAVTIALPQDVQAETWDFPESFLARRVHRIERPAPTEAMLEDGAELFAQARKPFLICGGGVRYSEAGPQLLQFCREFNIPFGETQAGKSAIPYGEPLNMGGVGVTGGLAANTIAKAADLIIGVGTRFTDFTTASKSLFQQDGVKFLNINPSRFHAGKLDGTAITADAKAGLAALAEKLRAMGYKSAYSTEYGEAKAEWDREITRLFNVKYQEGFKPEVAGHLDSALPEYAAAFGSRLTQTEVLGALQEILDEDAVAVGASGSLPGCMQRVWLPKLPDTYNMEYGYSCMGYEICGALGVKIAEPDKEVYAMTGDGSFLMLHSELVTSIQMGIKINVMLFDNAGFGCINNLQMSSGMDSFCTEFRKGNRPDGEIMVIDYAKIAEGYGAASYTIRTLEDLRAAVKDAKAGDRSALFDIKVLPKTMTEGYGAWWNTGVASAAAKESIRQAYRRKLENLNKARKY